MEDNNNKICGGCLLYIPNYLGGECSITDNAVDYCQPACIDYINADPETIAEADTEPK